MFPIFIFFNKDDLPSLDFDGVEDMLPNWYWPIAIGTILLGLLLMPITIIFHTELNKCFGIGYGIYLSVFNMVNILVQYYTFVCYELCKMWTNNHFIWQILFLSIPSIIATYFFHIKIYYLYNLTLNYLNI